MNRYVILLVSCLFLNVLSTFGRNDPDREGKSKKPNNNSSFVLKAANCTPSTGRKFLEFNNVSALIETGGSMWQDRSRNDAAYEVPKGSGETVIYAGALWMGGTDVNNQLRIAALTFRNGNDFWAGPLSVTGGQPADIQNGKLAYGFADISTEVCVEYDNFYITQRQDIELFNAWYECSNDPDCDVTSEYPDYQTPSSILDWPGNFKFGLDPSQEYDFNLAPFFDRNGNGIYNPSDGDYPWYDLTGQIDCRTNRRVTLYGDYNMWWVFNDKGNIHTETSADPIGMEIKAQAFAFATNDEVNSMTFYNYELINRSTQTLTNTYFGVYLDCDIGCSFDDYVGCDVQRGLGYCYNGNAIDAIGCGSWTTPIGENPPALGVDFFEGPYQDNDSIDNPLTLDVQNALDSAGIPYKGLGIGYGDSIIDNERFGMKRFVYYDGQLPQNSFGDPQNAIQYYNYMRGYWRDNTRFVFGASGNASSNGALVDVFTDYCFPGDSDPVHWGTSGIVTNFEWSEQNPAPGVSANVVGDRRFVQSAGPFVLEPGALNNITFGVVYGRAFDGDPFSSVEEVRKADDKAQALFDNCFRILNGPDSPELVIQELDKELILYLKKTETIEAYSEVDPIIISYGYTEEEAKYKFEGYQIYQVLNDAVDPSLLDDPNQARLIAQCDVKNGISQLVNFEFDKDILAPVPTEMVNGADEGIEHSFRVVNDAFAQGDVRLINHKKYYFMVIAYGYNNYKTYNPSDPSSLDGQQLPYKAGRKSITGGSITSTVGIPHIPSPENGGTLMMSNYGDGPKITRVEGRGNSSNVIEFTAESEADIVKNYVPKRVTYKNGKGPVNIKVVDPLNVQSGDFELWINPENGDLDESQWLLIKTSMGSDSLEIRDTVARSNQSIAIGNEQLLPDYGISINVEQYNSMLVDEYGDPIIPAAYLPQVLPSSIEFSDSSKQWLTGISDQDGSSPMNWIRSGTADEDPSYADYSSKCSDPTIYNDEVSAYDESETFEKIIEGTWAPYRLVASGDCQHQPVTAGGDWADNDWQLVTDADYWPDFNNSFSLAITKTYSDLKYLTSVDIVFTSDTSKWTRCPVLEMSDYPDDSWDRGGVVNSSWIVNGKGKYGDVPPSNTTVAHNTRVYKQYPKWQPSVDKMGNPSTDPGSYDSPNESTNPNDPNYICGYGMGWFPGYAIDVTTGERLNMAFGEDSKFGNHGGNDMLFNPSAGERDASFQYVGAGKHFIYVFRNAAREPTNVDQGKMPAYDNGSFFMEVFNKNVMRPDMLRLWRSCAWVGYPKLNVDYYPEYKDFSPTDNKSFIATDVRVKLRVSSKYDKLNTLDSDLDGIRDDASSSANSGTGSDNNWNPVYEFSTADLAVQQGVNSAAEDACSLLNVVPNPYYAYSNYEFDKLDNVIKIVNLPTVCDIKIYTVNGTLVRTFKKDDPNTYLNWDLKNQFNIPISSGIYLIHIKSDACEKVLKWFGVIRPPDLDSF